MDFTKYVSLLDHRALFFARPDRLDDKFEGWLTAANFAAQRQKLARLATILRESGLQSTWDTTPAPSGWEDTLKWVASHTVVNCWHMNDHESALMWRAYVCSGDGVAIESTFQRLTDCFADYVDNDVHVGTVTYLDYDADEMPYDDHFRPLLHKRKLFVDEHELRAVIAKFPDDEPGSWVADPPHGIYVPVNLDVLVNRIFVSPKSASWLQKLVDSVTRKYGLSKEVWQSRLVDDPSQLV